jgi:asparaginyl-tRNA synthetase
VGDPRDADRTDRGIGSGLSLAEEGAHAGVPAHDRAFAAALEPVRRRVPDAEPAGVRGAPFFQERDFVYVHTPIITASDCEGAGEMFRVTTLKGDPTKAGGDFFGKPRYLTVSGQLEGETFACALSNIYTFGPTFRAENSNTARHAAEFWMIEPEMAFCDLQGDMDLAEEFVKAMARHTWSIAPRTWRSSPVRGQGVHERLQFVVERPFVSVPYTERSRS